MLVALFIGTFLLLAAVAVVTHRPRASHSQKMRQEALRRYRVDVDADR